MASLRDDCQRAAQARLMANAYSAAARIVSLLDSEDERIALSAAQTLLDRTGHVKAERVEVGGAIATASAVIVDPSENVTVTMVGVDVTEATPLAVLRDSDIYVDQLYQRAPDHGRCHPGPEE